MYIYIYNSYPHTHPHITFIPINSYSHPYILSIAAMMQELMRFMRLNNSRLDNQDSHILHIHSRNATHTTTHTATHKGRYNTHCNTQRALQHTLQHTYIHVHAHTYLYTHPYILSIAATMK